MNEWNIQSRAHVCSACEQQFTDKQTYHTVLFEECSEFRRRDLCEACWQRDFGHDARDRKGFISYWHGVYEVPPAKVEVVQKESAETLLRKLIEQNDPQYGPASYILAVMLERKRLLRVKEEFVRDDRRVFIYEQPKTGDIFTITDPNLQLTQLAQVQHDVAHLLEHGFTPATAEGSQTLEPEPPTLPPVTPDTVVAAAEAPVDEIQPA